MKTTFFAAATLAAAFLAVDASAQTPAPVVTPSQAPAVATPATPATAPNQVVYAQRLPSAAELSTAAAAQGMTVERIEQNANQVTAVYKLANGQVNTVLYQLLPPAGSAAPAAAVAANPAANTTTTVIYESAPRVIYYDDPYYYPRYWYPPVSLSFGFGHWSHHGHHHHHHPRGHWRR